MVFGRVRDFRSVSSLCRVAAVVAVGLAVLASGAESATAKIKFSAIAVDARTGKILFSQDPDGLRHPASLTKVMTLYLLFEQLKAGKIHLELAPEGFPRRLPAAADEAGSARRSDHCRRGCDQGSGDQIGQ